LMLLVLDVLVSLSIIFRLLAVFARILVL
jgi:hypothetical protein